MGRFIQLLTYKAERSGGRLVRVSARHTSQDCSGCGVRVRKALRVRTHECQACGLVLDRDINAARNILARGHAKANEGGDPSGSITWPVTACVLPEPSSPDQPGARDTAGLPASADQPVLPDNPFTPRSVTLGYAGGVLHRLAHRSAHMDVPGGVV